MSDVSLQVKPEYTCWVVGGSVTCGQADPFGRSFALKHVTCPNCLSTVERYVSDIGKLTSTQRQLENMKQIAETERRKAEDAERRAARDVDNAEIKCALDQCRRDWSEQASAWEKERQSLTRPERVLRRMATLMRELGVTRYRSRGVSIELGELARSTSASLSETPEERAARRKAEQAQHDEILFASSEGMTGEGMTGEGDGA